MSAGRGASARTTGFTVEAMAQRPDAFELIVGATVDPETRALPVHGDGGGLAQRMVGAELLQHLDGASAFVSIMEGCSKYCSYCVVPYTRGEEVSRRFDDVLAEVPGCAIASDQPYREADLASRTNVTPRTVANSLASLESAGLIEVSPGSGRGNAYTAPGFAPAPR